MCTKVCFTKVEAQGALNNMTKHHRKYRREKRMYYCDKCKAWHLTKQDKEETLNIPILFTEDWQKLINNEHTNI